MARRRSRRARLLARQQRISRDRLARQIGERVTVMIDGPAGGGDEAGPRAWAARTAGSAYEVDGGVVVEGAGEALLPGRRVPVRVTGSSAYDLFARLDSEVCLPLVKGPA